MANVDSMREQWLNPIDEPEDLRPICKYCGCIHSGTYRYEDWCTPRCSILDSLGEMSRQIRFLIDAFNWSFEEVVKSLIDYGWFEGVSDYSTDRWLRAIWNRLK